MLALHATLHKRFLTRSPAQVHRSQDIDDHPIPIGNSCPARELEEGFSLGQLYKPLEMCRRKSAPGENGITY